MEAKTKEQQEINKSNLNQINRPNISSVQISNVLGKQVRSSENRNVEDEETMKRRRLEVLQVLGTDAKLSTIDSNVSNAGVKVKLSSTMNTSNKRVALLSGSMDEDVEELKVRQFIPLDYEDGQIVKTDVEEITDKGDDSAKQFRSSNAPRGPTDISTAQANAAKQAQEISNKIVSQLAEEERRKKLIESIPWDKNELFEYPVKWNIIESENIIELVVQPWISKKMIEYLGEEEKTLIQFIISKLQGRCHPNELLSELALVLDDDAIQFVIKLWRLVIYNVIKHDKL